MIKATMKALEGSIRKWLKIINNKGVDDRSSNCPLCKRFLFLEEDESNRPIPKDICPLGYMTKIPCQGLCCKEWDDWARHHRNVHGLKVTDNNIQPLSIHPGCDDCKALAQNVLDRLRFEYDKKRKEQD